LAKKKLTKTAKKNFFFFLKFICMCWTDSNFRIHRSYIF
jgi:hypothetical protein